MVHLTGIDANQIREMLALGFTVHRNGQREAASNQQSNEPGDDQSHPAQVVVHLGRIAAGQCALDPVDTGLHAFKLDFNAREPVRLRCRGDALALQ